MRLSPHFTLAELTVTNTGLDNTPPEYILDRLLLTADRLEAVREVLGHPMHITSGWRSNLVNERVGGVPNSDHKNGYVIDFTCPGFGTPYEVCKAIVKSGIKFDQLIHERRRWVHLSFAPKMRQQILTLPVRGRAYKTGLFK